MAMLALSFTRRAMTCSKVTTREKGVIPGCILPEKVSRISDSIVGQINADGWCESIRRWMLGKGHPDFISEDDMMKMWAGDPTKLPLMPEWGKFPKVKSAN